MFSKHTTNCEVLNLKASICHVRSTQGKYVLLANKHVIREPRLE